MLVTAESRGALIAGLLCVLSLAGTVLWLVQDWRKNVRGRDEDDR
jgi:hypothetical protein